MDPDQHASKEIADVAAFCDEQSLRVVRVTYGIVGDLNVAEELAQETFVRVYMHWERVRSADSPSAWVAKVASNLANSWWRRRYAEVRANHRHGPGPQSTADADVANRLAVREAVASLPRRQRTAISLRYFGQMSVAETAYAMGCREGTVKSLTSKAMHRLRDLLDGESQRRAPVERPAVRAMTATPCREDD